jgi:hypothetical protein
MSRQTNGKTFGPGRQGSIAAVTIEHAIPVELSKGLMRPAVWLLTALVAMPLVLAVITVPRIEVSLLFLTQDRIWLAAAGMFLLALTVYQPVTPLNAVIRSCTASPERTLLLLVLLVFVIAFAGTFHIQLDYQRSRDELMAIFDAQIFSRGHLLEPVPAEWRNYNTALLPCFGLPVAEFAGWASSYLPGNAAFHALMSTLLMPQLANPLLAAIGVWHCFWLARTLWPERPDAALVAALLMATSTQMLFMAMTSFAMTGHMTLTLIWLRLFIRNDRIGHAGAIAVGFVATGWHQMVFHPLLAAPFVLNLLWTRRWAATAAYAIAYAAIGLFWICYWSWAAAASDMALITASGSSIVAFMLRIKELLENFSAVGILIMLLNMLRFIVWQNPLLLPLTCIALVTLRHAPLTMQLSAYGLYLTIAAMFILLPFQGHGWGYRYIHGYIGVVCLMAAYGWLRIVPASRRGQTAVWTPLAAACGFVALVLFPAQAVQVRNYIGPYANASAAIARADADIVVVDANRMFYGDDFVRNDPFLQNRPVTLHLMLLSNEQIKGLCDRGARVAVFGDTVGESYGVRLVGNGDRRPPALRELLMAQPCVRELRPLPR